VQREQHPMTIGSDDTEDEDKNTATGNGSDGHRGVRQRRGNNNGIDNVGLSVVSQQYDRGNKGYLDPTESMLRQMDEENRGYLDVHKVYELMVTLQSEQKKAMNLKRIVVVLAVFSLLLALSNIGTSFAAAMLAKDLSVSQDGDGSSNDLKVRLTGVRAGTTPKIDIYNFPDEFGELRNDTIVNVTDGPGRSRKLLTVYDYYFGHDYAGFTHSASEVVRMHSNLCNQFTLAQFLTWNGDANYFSCTSGSPNVKLAYWCVQLVAVRVVCTPASPTFSSSLFSRKPRLLPLLSSLPLVCFPRPRPHPHTHSGLVKTMQYHSKPVFSTVSGKKMISISFQAVDTLTVYTFTCDQAQSTCEAPDIIKNECLAQKVALGGIAVYTLLPETPALVINEFMQDICTLYPGFGDQYLFNCTYSYPGYTVAYPKDKNVNLW